MTRASPPMRMRFSSLRMPCTMRSAAASGVVRATRAKRATISLRPALLTPAAARAFAAIGVRMPPGCTPENLTVLVAQRLPQAAHLELARGLARLAGRGHDSQDRPEGD